MSILRVPELAEELRTAAVEIRKEQEHLGTSISEQSAVIEVTKLVNSFLHDVETSVMLFKSEDLFSKLNRAENHFKEDMRATRPVFRPWSQRNAISDTVSKALNNMSYSEFVLTDAECSLREGMTPIFIDSVQERVNA